MRLYRGHRTLSYRPRNEAFSFLLLRSYKGHRIRGIVTSKRGLLLSQLMILSDGECRCVFMLAMTLESVMWAHAGALPFSGNFYERSQRGAL
jgi:hypothetical protein